MHSNFPDHFSEHFPNSKTFKLFMLRLQPSLTNVCHELIAFSGCFVICLSTGGISQIQSYVKI